jgi:hypothetical protein
LKSNGFREMPLLFPPTYKFDGARLSDKRSPSWCDRVFFKQSGECELTSEQYGSVSSCTVSDHKPVFATFTLSFYPLTDRQTTPQTPPSAPPVLTDLLSGDGDQERRQESRNRRASEDLLDLLL